MKRKIVLFLIAFLAFSLNGHAAEAKLEIKDQKAVINKTSSQGSESGLQQELKQKTRKSNPGGVSMHPEPIDNKDRTSDKTYNKKPNMPVEPLEKQVRQADTPYNNKANMPIDPLEKEAGSVR